MHNAKSLAGRLVLVVEDEFIIADEIAYSLQKAGAHVLGPVGGVADALRLIETAPRIDAALVDLNLHGEMAFPVADALCERAVPMAFASGYDGGMIPSRYASVARYQKPFDMLQAVNALFG
jgi:DNA-binding response OmpR family regulator